MNDDLAKYGLPSEVTFCKKCVISNQRPNPTGEFKFNTKTQKDTTGFDAEQICNACKFSEMKDAEINWSERENELIEICNKQI